MIGPRWGDLPSCALGSNLLYLRLFGGLVLEEDGRALTGRAAQKRRLALLSLLATSPGRSATRDRITGILWPDRDDEQARHLLNVAAYEIRKELGEDVLVSRGDDLVLEPAAVGCDVVDFEAALEEGRHADAISLYTGPFLDGVHLGGSAAFDHWLDEQREQYARGYRRALEAQAEALEAAGDAPGAVEAWSRLAASDRYDSRIALRLIRALDAAGNRPRALQFARVHDQLLEQEFGTAPDPAFVEEVRRLKEAPAAARPRERPAPPAPRPPAAATGPEPAAGSGGKAAAASGAQPAGEPGVAATSAGRASSGDRDGGTASILRAAVVVALVLTAAGFGAFLAARGTPAPAEDPAVLVLPFSTEDEADVPFADGLSEEIMDALGKAGDVRVTARSTAFSLRGLDAREAARRIEVDHVLEGSVRRDGERLRISVQLSGADGFRTWSESYDRPVGAVMETWDEIAMAVLNALEVELGPRTLPTAAGGTDDIVAYDLYLRGRHAWFRRTPEGLSQAIAYFQQALEIDPRYARAHNGIADAYNLLGAYDYGLLPPDSAYPRARRAAERALALAPDLGQAHAALGTVLFAYERDVAAADSAFRNAIRLAPRYAEAHHWHGLVLFVAGQHEEALAAARRAIEIDPLSPVMHSGLGRQLYFRGEYESALASFQTALEIEPSFVTALHGAALTLLELERYDDALGSVRRALDILGRPHPIVLALLGHAYGRARQHDQARDVLRQLDQLESAGAFVPPEYRGIVHLALGEIEQALSHLEAAADQRSGSALFLAVDPLTRPLHHHPRFRALVQRVGVSVSAS